MFVSGATALGIVVLVGGGTAGIQTPLAAPAAGVTATPAASAAEDQAQPSPLSVRVRKPARPSAALAAVSPLVLADVPRAARVLAERRADKPAHVVVPVVAAASVPEPVTVTTAPSLVVAAAPPAKKAAVKAKSPKPVDVVAPEITALGAMTSEYRSERAQTPKKAKHKSH